MSHLADAVQLGSVLVYVHDEVTADSRVSFVPRVEGSAWFGASVRVRRFSMGTVQGYV